ncbi:hypothetical protein GCM10010123_25010 [Pilimelia anulata]|uniref:ABC transport system permease protein n=1 Tax=Pilimelia anulata TaxID=53371 RepID=A0A8J3F9L0_9ACTN|nr:hypothetical protein [Pilimelia anulata]GGJ94140.1 hypothetical protein GCM10010123_25010 [Pilimelia anulata]
MIGRRLRAYAAHVAALAVLTGTAALVFTAAPRLTARATDAGLRATVAGTQPRARDLEYRFDARGLPDDPTPAAGAAELDGFGAGLPPAVRRLVAERWYGTSVDPGQLAAAGADLHPDRQALTIGLRTLTGARDAAVLTAGRWPRSTPAALEVTVADGVARQLDLRVGARFTLGRTQAGGAPVPARIVGVFAARDPAAGLWQLEPGVLAVPPTAADTPYEVSALTDDAGMTAAVGHGWPVTHAWTYRTDPGRIRAADLDAVLRGLDAVARGTPPGVRFGTGLARPLDRFAAARAANAATAATVSGGVFAALVGLVGLAAALLARRRRGEIALLRARGAGARTVAARALAEGLLTAGPALAVGVLAGYLLPGAPAGPPWLALASGVAGVLALPAAFLAALRPPARGGRRAAAARRLVAEVLVLAVTAGAVAAARAGGGALLVAVPVLVAASATVLALRLYPLLLRPVARLAARSRGAAFFLGTARLSRAPQPLAGPLIAVVALTTALAAAAIDGSIAAGRDTAADRAVPGDAVVTGQPLPAPTVAALTAAPRAAAVLSGFADRRMGASESAEVIGYTLVVDAPALAAVHRATGRGRAVPAALAGGPACGDGPVPAVVSPALAARLPGRGVTRVHDQRCEFAVAAVADWFPAVPAGVAYFVVLPRAAVTAHAGRPLEPTAIAVAGTAGGVAGPGVEVRRWTGYRAELDARGVHPILAAALRLGTGAGLLLALLAIGFGVLAGAAERVALRRRVRTLGLTAGQWRLLLAVELGVPLAVTLLTAAAAGAALPRLLAPALRLTDFTDGAPAPVGVTAGQVALVLGVGAAAAAVALAVEGAAGRRRGGRDEGEVT